MVPTMWYCTDGHNTNEVFAESFQHLASGYDYELEWTSRNLIQPKDIVKHGGYSIQH